MTWSISEIMTTTFSFVFLITTIISYVYSEYPYIKIPLTISTILLIGFNIAAVLLHARGAWDSDSGSIERKAHIGLGIGQFLLTVIIILIIKALN
jgi:hypothetical protein